MVGSIRHWATAAKVISKDGRKTRQLGRFLFQKNGLDPYIEDPATAWLIHWMISGNPDSTTWFWAFNHYSSLTFYRDTLVREIEKFAKNHHPKSRAATSTIKNDVACFVRTYVSQSPSEKTGYEESLESPLTELGLIQSTGKRDGFQFVKGRKPTLGAGVVAYAVYEFWSDYSHSTARSLSFETLAYEPGSPGRVFVLDENSLADLLLEVETVSGGVYRWSETAGLKQLTRKHEITRKQALKFIEHDYGRGLHRDAA